MFINKVDRITPKITISNSLAIVGSSAKILEHNWGEIIDSHTDIIRFNRAPTEGYEKYVGNKTTIRVANNHVFRCQPYANQPVNFIREQKNCKIVCIGYDMLNINIKKESQKLHSSVETYGFARRGIQVEGYNTPTAGLMMINYCINRGIIPNVYGFYGIPKKKSLEGLTHYWENRVNESIHHNYNIERDIVKKWNNEGKIILHL